MRSARLRTAAVLILTAIYVAVNSLCLRWFNDDLVYRFITDTLDPVRTVGDVVRSQWAHYLTVNGRAPLHVVLQIFSGVAGQAAFSVVNGIVFALFVALTVRLITMPPRLRSLRESSWMYLFVSFVMIVLFPLAGVIWYSISLSINYLWAGCLAAGTLLAVNSCGERRMRPFKMVAACVLAFFCGWSNEAFAIPMCGGLILYSSFGRRFNRSQNILLLCLITGAALLIFAPGTWHRVSDQMDSGGLKHMVVTLFECYKDVILIWLLVLSALVCVILCGRQRIRALVVESALPLLMLAIAAVFSAYAHTYAQSLFFIEYLSLVLLVRLVTGVKNFTVARSNNPAGSIAFATATVAFAALMVYVYHINVVTVKAVDAMERDFIGNPYGLCRLDLSQPSRPALIDRLTFAGQLSYDNPSQYTSRHFSAYLGQMPKLPVKLTPDDYDLVTDSRRLESGHRAVRGSAGVLEGDTRYYRLLGENDTVPVRYVAYFDDVSFLESHSIVNRIIYRLLFNGKKPPKALKSETVVTPAGRVDFIERLTSTPSRIETETSSRQ